MRGLLLSGLMVALASSSTSHAAEVSLLSGLYKQEKQKQDGEDAGDRSEIELGGRYADEYDVGMTWFGEGIMTMRSYDAPSGETSPSDSTSLNLGGGLRMYFDPFTQAIAPFIYGKLAYLNDKQADLIARTETETNGLFYSMHTGVRFGFDQNLFVDLELPLFTSALNATTTVELK